MTKQNRKFGPPGLTLVLTLALASSAWAADVITTDKINGYEGVLQGATSFVASGRPHAVGSDYAVDTSGGGVLIADASFLNTATANDTLTFAFWVKKYAMTGNSAFWAVSPSSPSTSRGFQAHLPWTDNTIYFDTAGCCDPGVTRISALATTIPGYTDVTWWDGWHHFVFFKNGSDKQVWVDGQLFLQGAGTTPLPTDMTSLLLGISNDNNIMQGQMDDFAVFANALSPADIASLFNGTAPDALGGANQLLAYWNFNDAQVFGAAVGSPLGFTINVNDVGASVMDASTIALSLDGATITPTSALKTGSVTEIEYLLPNPPFESGSTHTVDLTIQDAGGAAYSTTSSFVVASFGLLSSDMALPPASVDKNLKGFKIRTYQVDGVNAGNGVQAAEDVLDGKLGPNVAYLDDLGGVDAKGYFTFADVINLDTLEDPAAVNGHFIQPDYFEFGFPGIPGNTLSYTNFACEIYAALEFTQAGLYTMVVNSDDCFATTSGPNPLDSFGAAQLGRFDAPGGRGWADTSFQLFVQTPGLYGFRTVYQQGGGDGNIEWFMANDNGVRVLINDSTNAIPAYQWLPTITGAYVKSITPLDNAQNAGPALVEAVVVDGAASAALFGLQIDDTPVQLSISKVGKENTLTYVPDPIFASDSTHTATLTFTDGPTVVTNEWSFTVASYTKDIVNNHIGLILPATVYVPASERPFAASSNMAIDLTPTGGAVLVEDASFLNAAAATDTLAVSFWVKKYDIADSSAFWVRSPTQDRVFQGHTPWSNNGVYFDTSGCCDGVTQRMDAAITNFLGYVDQTWWEDWHHWVFQKSGQNKEIWIDGQLFLAKVNTAVLPTDITQMLIGAENVNNHYMHGQMDDFAVYGSALTPADTLALATGTAPNALTSNPTILAYWPFDDGQAVAQPTISLDAEGNILFTGVLQESDSVIGGWTDLLEATSPYAMPTTGAMKFYRTRD